MSLQSKLESGQFAISCEFGPLKGTDTHEIKGKYRNPQG